ncbi:MAG: response regulator receiver protein [Pseudomonadota bacterium]
MEIFAVRRDGYKYQELDLEIDDFIDIFRDELDYNTIQDFSINNLSLANYWQPLSTGFSTIARQENLIPDIANWIGATLLLSPKAYRYLGDLLSPFGEFLPIQIESETFQIFNCLTVAEINSVPGDSEKFSFNEDSIGDKLIFKTPYQHCLDIYCTARFQEAVESFDLKGVIFDKNILSPFSE